MIKGLSRTQAKEAHMAGAYTGFHSMKQLRVLLLPPGRDASPSKMDKHPGHLFFSETSKDVCVSYK